MERTEPIQAATVAALGDLGYAGTKIAAITGVAWRTVYDILGGQKNYLKTPVHAKLRSQIKERLQFRSLDIADRALNQVEQTLPWAEARDAAVVYGILRQHERLDAGEPTQITEHVGESFHLDDFLSALSEIAQARQAEKRNEIDVTPAQDVGK